MIRSGEGGRYLLVALMGCDAAFDAQGRSSFRSGTGSGSGHEAIPGAILRLKADSAAERATAACLLAEAGPAAKEAATATLTGA
jgi:hypothetical protein